MEGLLLSMPSTKFPVAIRPGDQTIHIIVALSICSYALVVSDPQQESAIYL